jgi:hypothetical protein
MMYIPVLLSAAIVEELELKTKTDHTPPTTRSNQFQLLHDSSRQQYGYVRFHYSIEHVEFSADYTFLITIII